MGASLQTESGPAAVRLFFDQLGQLGWRYWTLAALAVVVGLAALLPAGFLQFFTENSVSPGQSSQMGALFGFGLAAAAVLWATGAFVRYFQDRFRFRIEGDLRRSIVRRLHQIPLTALDGSARGEWVERVTSDLSAVEKFLSERFPRQIRHGALFLGVAVCLVSRGGAAAVVALVGSALLALAQDYLERRASPGLARAEAVHASGLSLLRETLGGMRTIRSHGAEPFLERRFEAKLSAFEGPSLNPTLPQGFTLQVLFTVTLTAAAWSIEQGQIPVRDALVFPFFLALLYRGALGLVQAAAEWRGFLVEGSRLGSVIYGTDRFAAPPEPERAVPLFKHAQTLDVRDLRLHSRNGSEGGPFDLQLNRGELWAIIGPPACGKSTLLEVLGGLRPAVSGSARVVHKDGSLLWESHAAQGLWLPVGACAYVEPRPFLFEGTLRENLTFGNADRLSDAVLWDFLERTGLYDFARERGGLDTVLQLDREPLSESDRFRIALCRGLLTKRPFLLLDEPFRGLDDRTIGEIAATLEFQKRYSGLVLITQTVPLALSVDGLFSIERGVDGWRGQADGPEAVEGTGQRMPGFARLHASAVSPQPATPTS
jgi:ABC-type multidrug transport system fused ATPase/permease subunit